MSTPAFSSPVAIVAGHHCSPTLPSVILPPVDTKHRAQTPLPSPMFHPSCHFVSLYRAPAVALPTPTLTACHLHLVPRLLSCISCLGRIIYLFNAGKACFSQIEVPVNAWTRARTLAPMSYLRSCANGRASTPRTRARAPRSLRAAMSRLGNHTRRSAEHPESRARQLYAADRARAAPV